MTESLESLVADGAPDGVIVTGQDDVVVYWNRGAEEILGFNAKDALGVSIIDLLFPMEDRDSDANHSWLSHKSSISFAFELALPRKNGSTVNLVMSNRIVTGSDGSKLMVSTMKDVTAIQTLRDAKAVTDRFRDLLESTPDAVVMESSNGLIVLANSQAEELFGYDKGELLGQPVETLLPERYHPEQTEQGSYSFKQPKARSTYATMELYGIRKGGDEFPVEISLSPLKTEGCQLVITAIRDNTERKRIEQALHDKNEELLSAAEAKDRFLANMSHELRTPLNGIIGFSEFLVEKKPGPLNFKQLEYLGDILSSGKHLLQLINDILDLAKVESGKMAFVAESFSVSGAIAEVCAVTKPLSMKKNIHVTVDADSSINLVKLDIQKFKQVLYNLLSNAIKFTENRGKVLVAVRRIGADKFQVSVADTGIGIRMEDLPRLFIEFEQLESGANRHYGGTGLGLVLTKKIVEMQGGSITVESEVGKGSTFSVLLPLVAP